MDLLIPSLVVLVDPFSHCFRIEAFQMFRLLLGAWIVCLGRRTISRVWETTGQAEERNHSAAFRLFSKAVWDWDEVCHSLLCTILVHLVPNSDIFVLVDDTLCHKRGAKVAFGGIFLDAVLSSKRHKVLRFGNNWVMAGIAVKLPFRERYFCLPVLWRIYQKKGQAAGEHQTKSQLAAEMIRVIAEWFPNRKILVVGDSAYVGQHLLKDRPANVELIGPMRWDAVLTAPLDEGHSSRRRRGERLPTPAQMIEDDENYPPAESLLDFSSCQRQLAIKVVKNVCWYQAAGQAPLQLILVRDPEGKWRNEVLVSTDLGLTAEEIILGYCRRWSIEVAFCDAKQLLGFHDPRVWCEKSVERAAPMSWFVGSLVVVWYALVGREGEQAQRQRPWYQNKPEPTFADMLAACRLQHWLYWLTEGCGSDEEFQEQLDWLLNYLATAE